MPDRSDPRTPCDYLAIKDCECDVPCRSMLDADPNWPPPRPSTDDLLRRIGLDEWASESDETGTR